MHVTQAEDGQATDGGFAGLFVVRRFAWTVSYKCGSFTCSLPPHGHDCEATISGAGIPLFTLLKIDSTHCDDVASRDKQPLPHRLPQPPSSPSSRLWQRTSHAPIGMQPSARRPHLKYLERNLAWRRRHGEDESNYAF